MTLRRKLPSSQSIFTFEAAARTLNFREAGQALNITQPAVSKTIAALEAHIGARLFSRERSKLSLTREGEILNKAVQLSFSALENAIDQIHRGIKHSDGLTLSLTTSFAAHWLIPQMDEFRRLFPDVLLDFQLTGGEPSGPVSPCDLGLRLETRVAAGDDPIDFAPEWLVAVASPDYIQRHGRLDDPRADGAHALVSLATPRIPWTEFLSETNQTIATGIPEIRVPDYSVVLQTALNGRGVALGYMSSCSLMLQQGLLVPALPLTLRTGKKYCLVYPASGRHPLAVKVASWIVERSNRILGSVARQIEKPEM